MSRSSASAADRRAGRHAGPHHDRGAGLLGTTLGFVVFLAFCLFAVHLLLRLHAATVVSSAALDGARHVASATVDHTDDRAVASARTEADAEVRALLGQVGGSATLDWSASTGDEVVLRVVVPVPDVLPGGLDAELPFDVIDRTARVRVEELR